MPPNNRPRVSLFSASAAAVLLPAGVVALWPMLLAGGPLLFVDSATYLATGADILAALGLGGDGAAGAGIARGSVRSLPYAAFAALTARTSLGPGLTLYLQTLLVLAPAYALAAPTLARAGSGRAAAAGLLLAAATGLPFASAYLMPDILGAAVLLYALLLVRGSGYLTRSSRIALAAIALFALAAHYGNIALGFGAFSAAIALRVRRGTADGPDLALAAAPLAGVLALNAGLGGLAFDTPSFTPARKPLLLVRSIVDGPARWHLEEACPEAAYAACALWEQDYPESVHAALWGKGGLNAAAPATKAAIRREEPIILWRAFRAYPLRQSAAILTNAGRQALAVGTSDFRLAPPGEAPGRATARLLAGFGGLHLAAYIVGLGALGIFARRGQGREMIMVLVIGLALNALVFGGLSAPTDRYQARLAWLAPFLALMLGLEARARREGGPGPHTLPH